MCSHALRCAAPVLVVACLTSACSSSCRAGKGGSTKTPTAADSGATRPLDLNALARAAVGPPASFAVFALRRLEADIPGLSSLEDDVARLEQALMAQVRAKVPAARGAMSEGLSVSPDPRPTRLARGSNTSVFRRVLDGFVATPAAAAAAEPTDGRRRHSVVFARLAYGFTPSGALIHPPFHCRAFHPGGGPATTGPAPVRWAIGPS